MAEKFDLQVVLELVDRLSAPLSKPMEKLQALEAQAKRVEKGMSQMLQGAAIAGAGAAIIAPLAKATEAASDLNESLNKNQVIFQSDSNAVVQWAQNSARAFGMSKQAALENASTLGHLFQGMGIGTKKSAAMSMELTQAASDMASLGNTSIQQAADAIRSAVLNEGEPIAAYGVKLSEANIQQQAFLMGLSKSPKNSALSDATKALAITGLITSKLAARTKGDFQRTAGELANMQRIVQAQMQDSAAAIGSALLPAALALVRGFSRLLEKLNGFIAAHPHLSRGLIVLTAVIGGLLIVGGSLLVMLGALNVAWGNAVAGQALLSGWYKRNIVETYQNAIAVAAWRTSTDMATFATLRQATGLAGLRLALIGVKIQFLSAANAGWLFTKKTLTGMWTGLVGLIPTLYGAATAAWAFVAPLLANPITWVVLGVVALIAVLWGLWKVLRPVREMFGKVWESIQYGVGFIVGLLQGVFINAFKGAVRAVWYTLGGLIDVVAGVIKVVVGLFTGNLGMVQEGAAKAMGGLRAIFDNTIGWLFTLPAKLAQVGVNMAKALWNGLVWLLTLPARMTWMGIQLMLGLGQGIKAGAKRVWNGIRDVATGALSRFKNYFGIHSPSRVFAEQGQHLMDGLSDGMKNRAPRLYDFITRVIGPKLLNALKNGWDRAKAFGGNILSTVGGMFGSGGNGSSSGGATVNSGDFILPAGAEGGSKIARAAVAGLTAGWAESIPGYCSRFVRQVFAKALGPQTAKLFSGSAIETEKVWKRQGLAKTLAEIGGKAALRAGDVLFQGFGSGGYGHTGVYVGNGMVAQNTTAAGGGKKLLTLASFGAITSVGRIPTAPTAASAHPPIAPAAPRPTARSTLQGKGGVVIQNLHLPNVREPHEFATAMQQLHEAHK